ncbi:MAG: PTS ascorbate transporter subunit IIC [Anaerolineae bacterium]|jgi:PTS system ascorbate-specific IIC component|nr:PTS ascorbate transporter subunit IIC [Anaerolineae bacterium]
MEVLNTIWTFIVSNIITQPAYFIGLIVIFGYILLKKPWYDVLAGGIKAVVGYLILIVGAGGLVSNFRPILVGLKDRFNLDAMVIDPYFGQNAVTAGVEEVFGRTFGQVMILVLIAFIFNIVLVALKKWTKMRAIFTTGHVQVQQASTAFWLILFAFPALGDTPILLIMALILGLYWAVGTNLTVEITQELTDGAGFSIAHQQMFGLKLFSWLSEKMSKKGKSSSKRLEDMEFPGFLAIFNENMVATSILMTLFFGTILLVLGQQYLVDAGFLAEGASFFFYILTTSLRFAVYLAILQLGVRTFVAELTQSFKGISDKLLPGAVPGVDCAVSYGFGSPNAVTIGFLFGALGQFLAILILILLQSPVLVIAGFVPVFFDNATIAVFANNKGGLKAAMLWPFVAGLCQVFGSALIAGWVGMAAYGGYLGMWDWAVMWPVFTVLMKYLSYAGVVIVAVALFMIPQLQYRNNKDSYFLVTEDYEAYKAKKAANEG